MQASLLHNSFYSGQDCFYNKKCKNRENQLVAKHFWPWFPPQQNEFWAISGFSSKSNNPWEAGDKNIREIFIEHLLCSHVIKSHNSPFTMSEETKVPRSSVFLQGCPGGARCQGLPTPPHCLPTGAAKKLSHMRTMGSVCSSTEDPTQASSPKEP